MVSITRWHCPPTYLLIITVRHCSNYYGRYKIPIQCADTKSPARLIDSIKRVNKEKRVKKKPSASRIFSVLASGVIIRWRLKSASLYTYVWTSNKFRYIPLPSRSDVLSSPEIGIRLAKAQRADG